MYDGEIYSTNYDIPEYDQAAAAAATPPSDCDEDKAEPTFAFAAADYDDYRGYRPEDEPANTYVATVDGQEGYGHYDAVVGKVETDPMTYGESVDCVCFFPEEKIISEAL